jgi:ribosome-associated toxin RatA of RatAB toxin-antitoxin module
VRTIDEQVCCASPDVAFQVAADVEAWPDILPHYRWVRFLRKDSFAHGVVEMAAWRHFGPMGYPTWWASEMEHDAASRVIRYRHIRGVTSGMDVVWQVRSLPDGSSHLSIVHEWDGPGWPLIGRFAADRVIGPGFVSHIAGLTLKGVAAEAARRQPSGN